MAKASVNVFAKTGGSNVDWVAWGTVFVSSRMEETGNLRRAAFEAILDSRLYPLTFETWPAVKPNRDKDNQRRTEKATIDSLIDGAAYFVGIYADSMGDHEDALYGMRPIEYELMRFVLLAYLREGGDPDGDDVSGGAAFLNDRVRKVFPDLGDSPAIVRLGSDYEKLERRFHLDIAKLAHKAALERLDLMGKRSANTSTGRAASVTMTEIYESMRQGGFDPTRMQRIYMERVRLFLRRRGSDGPVSTALMRSLRDKPYDEFHSYSRDADGFATYLPLMADLYKKVYDWTLSLDRPTMASGSPDVLVVRRTLDKAGFLQATTRMLYQIGMNVTETVIGYYKDRESKEVFRAIVHYANPYRAVESQSDKAEKELNDILGDLWKKHKPDGVAEKPQAEFVPADRVASHLVPCREPIGKRRAEPTRRYCISAMAADVPGMLYKLCDRVSEHGGSIVQVRHGKKVKNKAMKKWYQFKEDRAISPLEVVVHFESADVERMRCVLRAELRFLHGFYDVTIDEVE